MTSVLFGHLSETAVLVFRQSRAMSSFLLSIHAAESPSSLGSHASSETVDQVEFLS